MYCSGSKTCLQAEKVPGEQGLKAKPRVLLLLAVLVCLGNLVMRDPAPDVTQQSRAQCTRSPCITFDLCALCQLRSLWWLWSIRSLSLSVSDVCKALL